MRSRLRTSMIVPLVLAVSSAAFGWSHKEHAQFARLAAERLIADPSTPPEMKKWLEAACPKRFDMAGEEDYFLHKQIGLKPIEAFGPEHGVVHWVYMPDVRALGDSQDAKVQPFNAHERLLHYIDLEYFLTGDTPRAYKDDLSAKPKLESIPDDVRDPRYVQAGFLPIRVEQCYNDFVKAIREKRFDNEENNANYWAGYVAHYAADNTQPQHATIDYKSQSYFKNPRKAPNVHAAIEYLMCDDEKLEHAELRREFWPLFVKQLDEFKDPIQTTEPFRATLEVANVSYDYLPLIGHAAAQATAPAGPNDKTDVLDVEKFFRYREPDNELRVMDMKARQTAWAVKRIERVWRQAWDEATKDK